MPETNFTEEGPSRNILTRVINDARRSYGDTIDDVMLVTWASEAVLGLIGDSIKVTTFVPVLAMRQVHAEAAAYNRVNAA